MKKLMLGNHAVAYGALEAGVEVAAGYPGTPSSEALTELLNLARRGGATPYVEWSVNEKVAFEVACGAAWTGRRALATMKMSGANVAADSILSAAYSGTPGGLVIYVADDPGAEAGMPEQDTRVFAQFAGLPLLEASSPQRALFLTRYAFELSEQSELPVILRLVTSVAHAEETVEGGFTWRPLSRPPRFERDILRYTKAGSKICLDQHHDLLRRLGAAEARVHDDGINRMLADGGRESGLLAVACGSLIPYLQEFLAARGELGTLSLLGLEGLYPLDERRMLEALQGFRRIVVFEELEPVVETLVRALASRSGWRGTLLGKLDGLLPRVGKYGRAEIERGLSALRGASDRGAAASSAASSASSASSAAVVPPAPEVPSVRHVITFCAGCPHRGTYLALNRALKKSGLDRRKTIVTGDIGCTILGMNPPFDSCWTEVSMGSSIGYAQGFARAGIEEPVVATIGDSTFFHAGIPPLINAVQHRADLVLIVLDNGWTSMTGFQPNPGTQEDLQGDGARRVDIAAVVRALGVDSLQTVDPFDPEGSIEALQKALGEKGVRVILSRAECALTALRRRPARTVYGVDPERCTFCRACLRETGCPALVIGRHGDKDVMTVDAEQCTGCGLCFTCCKFQAIHREGGGSDV